MEISPILQGKLLIFSAIFGVIVGVAWDVSASFICCIRRGKIKSITVFFRDLLLVLTSGIGIILLCYYFNNGEIRAFAPLGFVVSFFCYRATLGRCVRPLLKTVLRIAFFIIRAIFTPFAKIFKYLVNIIKKAIQYGFKGLAKILALVYNIVVKKAIIQKAKKGFLE